MSYLTKDRNKFKNCNAIISRGAVGSSSDKYAKDVTILGLDPLVRVNDNAYSDIDIVGVSVNGQRKNRLSFDKDLVRAVLLAGAVIIKDSYEHTHRPFNVGERELEAFLIEMGAQCFDDNQERSIWFSRRSIDFE